MGVGLAIFTLVHVIISLVAILSGLFVMYGLIIAKRLSGWNALFLVTTVLTSVTGFLFPFHKFLPSHGVGIVSLIVLAVAIFALYGRGLAGPWRRTYVVSAVIGLYLNVFVLVAQMFMKIPALKALAPTGSEPPFLVAQVAVMLVFVIVGVLAAKRFPAGAVQAA